jgi:hypothetical protein
VGSSVVRRILGDEAIRRNPMKSTKNDTQKSAKGTPTGRVSKGFTDEERAAMREHAKEQRRSHAGYVDGESDVFEKIAEMPEPDRAMAERVHAIIVNVPPGTG